MNLHVITAGTIRVMLFTVSVFALMHGASIVLRNQASWIAMVVLLCLAAILAALAGCAWILRLLWRVSGTVAAAFVHETAMSQVQILPASEVETRSHLLARDTKEEPA